MDLMNFLRPTGCTEKLELSVLVKSASPTGGGYDPHQKVAKQSPLVIVSHSIAEWGFHIIIAGVGALSEIFPRNFSHYCHII